MYMSSEQPEIDFSHNVRTNFNTVPMWSHPIQRYSKSALLMVIEILVFPTFDHALQNRRYVIISHKYTHNKRSQQLQDSAYVANLYEITCKCMGEGLTNLISKVHVQHMNVSSIVPRLLLRKTELNRKAEIIIQIFTALDAQRMSDKCWAA